MFKKDFIALANTIRSFNLGGETDFTESQLNALADFCKSRNRQFKRDRWLDYIAGKCGPGGGTIRTKGKKQPRPRTTKSKKGAPGKC